MTDSIRDVPVFKLYGAPLEWPTPDLLHCESIPARSRLHDWEIKPHRHADLAQLLYVRKGWAQLQVEGEPTRVEQPSIQFVPPLCIHGFQFSERIDGYVLTLAAPLLARLQAHLGAQRQAREAPGLYPVGADRRYIDTLFDAIDSEYAGTAPARELLLQSLIGVLAVWLGRQVMVRRAEARPGRGQEYLSAFSQLVERHFREHLGIDEYARRLGISPAHLNGVARRLSGQTALGIVHQRLLLEAKRDLVYTAMTVNEIADRLGFSEPAYFTRFFKRLSGVSPSVFRKGD
ncbi:helix-turn-helix domain-containing protein [Pseudomonas aeruginosa]|nr:helix-turn-helix domain-containing protein [Pseudomonas aeruginosa]